MSNVVPLAGVAQCAVPGEPDQDCVALLEQWLEQARTGGIIGIAVAVVYPGTGGISSQWAGNASGLLMMAASTGLHTRVCAQWLEGLEE